MGARANDVVFVEKGQKAPYAGVLFTEQKAKELRSELLEKDSLVVREQSLIQQSKIDGRIISLREQEIDLYKKQNERLLKLDSNNEKMKYVWFGLGIVVTGIAVYGAGGLAR